MAYKNTPILNFPLGNFKNISLAFGQPSLYDKTYWGMHLGADLVARANTKVFAIGRGVVVYSKLHPGEFSEDGKIAKRNWGGLIVIAHRNPKTKKLFYSVYGHLGTRYLKKGDVAEMGELIGLVGKSMSESNGGWEKEHLHFGIFTGIFKGQVLPGYLREDEDRTRTEDWAEPISFINNYSASRPLI